MFFAITFVAVRLARALFYKSSAAPGTPQLLDQFVLDIVFIGNSGAAPHI